MEEERKVGRRYLGDANEGSGLGIPLDLTERFGAPENTLRAHDVGASVCVAEVSATYTCIKKTGMDQPCSATNASKASSGSGRQMWKPWP